MAYCWQYAGEQVAILPQKGKRINVFGLMSQGRELTAFSKHGSINAQFIVDSIDQWVRTITKPTVLVLDNAPVHQAKVFQAKIEQWQEQNLFIFFLPAYSPHLNRIEILWRKIKYEWLKPQSYCSIESLQEALNYVLMQFGKQYFINFKDYHL
jgi:transposase